MIDYGVHVKDVVGSEIWRASQEFKLIGHDPFRMPGFWEAWLATMLGGATTSAGAEHDVEVDIWGVRRNVECKFSNEFFMAYPPIRGKDWSRWVFKWAKPRGNAGKDSAHSVVLIGLTEADIVYSWCLPIDAISKTCRSITVASPRSRADDSVGPLDRHVVPFTEILPAVAAVCHNSHDAKMRHDGRKQRAAMDRAKGQGTLFPPESERELVQEGLL